MKKYLLWKPLAFGAMAAFSFSCEPKIDAPAPTTNEKLDLSNYVAIGNSLTAGYADNGLYLSGQKVAYPVLLAEQFKLAGGGEFNAPLFDAGAADGTGYLRLDGFNADGTPKLTSVPISPAAVAGKSAAAYDPNINPDSIVLQPYTGGKNHNFGVPGIRVKDIFTPGYGGKNPYMGRMIPDAEKPTRTYGSLVTDQNAKFFTCWLGNNDVLGFATAGGYVDMGKVTAKAEFETNYNQLINTLTSNGAKGAVANIPNVTSIPFFTTLGPSIKPKLAAVLDPAGKPITAFLEYKFDSIFLNTVMAALLNPDPNATILNPAKLVQNKIADIVGPSPTGTLDGKVFFTLTFSPYASKLGTPSGKAWRDIISKLVADYGLPSAIEASVWAKSGLDTLQPFGLSPKNPIPDVFILNANESARAKSAIATYNKVIKAAADSKGLAHVDVNNLLSKITSGAYYDAISTNASFISGGSFSLDGIHLTPRGNAVVANEFIKTINGKYGTGITVLNPGKYPGVRFP